MSFAVFFRVTDNAIVGYRSVLEGDQIEVVAGCDFIMVATRPEIPGYVDGQVCKKVPDRPSPSHDWDWPSKSWVLNEVSAAAARVKAAADALAAIDSAAGQTRLKYITSVPGQAETYQRKEQQAREWAAVGFVGQAPSFIAAEAEALSVSPQSVASEVIQLADYWANVKGPEIEAARRKWKVAVEAAGTDLSAIDAALNEGLAELGAL